VTSVSFDAEENTYTYDANGNMTCREEDGEWYIQEYNTENRISSIAKLAGGDCTTPGDYLSKWDFSYDGDGVRAATLITPYISGVPQSPMLTTYYFGGAYEVTGSDVRKYYSFGGQTILKDSTGLQYFLTDHLGSVVAITDDEGTLTSQQRYLPFGGVRTNIGPITQTDLGYTGQRDLGMGLMDYKARFYSPLLARFTQPDSLVPDPSNPQAFNRFSYTANNPINYNDPTGHDWQDCKEKMSDYLCKQHKKRVAGILKNNTNKSTTATTMTTTATTTNSNIYVSSSSCNTMISCMSRFGGASTFSRGGKVIQPAGTPTPAYTVQPIVLPTPAGTPYAHTLYIPEPNPPIDLPSGLDIVNFLFEPGPVGDPSIGDIVGEAIDSVPAVPLPNGAPLRNPLFGSGRAIGQGIDTGGLAIYLLLNYGELPAWGTPPPIISTPNLYTPRPIPPPIPETGTPLPP
jgi:RHS repeat-associated protein